MKGVGAKIAVKNELASVLLRWNGLVTTKDYLLSTYRMARQTARRGQTRSLLSDTKTSTGQGKHQILVDRTTSADIKDKDMTESSPFLG